MEEGVGVEDEKGCFGKGGDEVCSGWVRVVGEWVGGWWIPLRSAKTH